MDKFFLVVDWECQTEKRRDAPEKEIIEIGAIILEPKYGLEIGRLETFVKPTENPQLSEFCKELTGITQENVDPASPLSQVIHTFYWWIGRTLLDHRKVSLPEGDFSDVVFCSWGYFDWNQLKRECERKGLPFSFREFLNVKELEALDAGIKKGKGLSKAMARRKVSRTGSAHRALSDADGVAEILRRVKFPLVVRK